MEGSSYRWSQEATSSVTSVVCMEKRRAYIDPLRLQPMWREPRWEMHPELIFPFLPFLNQLDLRSTPNFRAKKYLNPSVIYPAWSHLSHYPPRSYIPMRLQNAVCRFCGGSTLICIYRSRTEEVIRMYPYLSFPIVIPSSKRASNVLYSNYSASTERGFHRETSFRFKSNTQGFHIFPHFNFLSLSPSYVEIWIWEREREEILVRIIELSCRRKRNTFYTCRSLFSTLNVVHSSIINGN